MKDSQYFNDLWQCSVDTLNRVDAWRTHGETQHNAGTSFAYHHLGASLSYALAHDHMTYRLDRHAELNQLATQPGGFANLPIPREVVLMTALLPAIQFLHAQAEIEAGKVDQLSMFSANEGLRDAARLVRRLMPHVELHKEVQQYLDLTDDDIARLKGLGDLHMVDVQGRA